MKIHSKFARRSLALATTALLAVGSQLAFAATQQLEGEVTIERRDITTQMAAVLDFGVVKVGSAGGTVTLTNDGTANTTVTGDIVKINGGTEGQLAIQGEKNEVVTVTIDESFVLSATGSTGGADLTVITAGQGGTLTLLANNGVWNFYNIGGTLTIPANQPSDIYAGTYNATVNYQ